MRNSYRAAGCCSVLFHFFQLRLLCQAYRDKRLKFPDLFSLDPQLDTLPPVNRLHTHWIESPSNPIPPSRVLCKSFGRLYALNCLLMVRPAHLDNMSIHAWSLHLPHHPLPPQSHWGLCSLPPAGTPARYYPELLLECPAPDHCLPPCSGFRSHSEEIFNSGPVFESLEAACVRGGVS